MAAAQEESPGVRFGGWGGFTMGPQKIDTGDLSHHLAPINVDMSDYQPSLGGFGYGVLFKHVIVGARGNYVWVDQVGEVTDVELTTYHYSGELGGAIFNNRWGMLFPFAGAGRAKHRLQFAENSQQQVVDIFGEDASFTKHGNFAIFGVQYLYPMPITPPEGGFAMFVGGVRLGGTIELSGTDWQDNDGNEPDVSPDYTFDTFFLMFDIGFGGGVM